MRMPMAAAMRAVARPMRPKPITPRVLPVSSICGVSQKQKSGQLSQRPSCTAWLWCATPWQISISIAMAN